MKNVSFILQNKLNGPIGQPIYQVFAIFTFKDNWDPVLALVIYKSRHNMHHNPIQWVTSLGQAEVTQEMWPSFASQNEYHLMECSHLCVKAFSQIPWLVIG